MADLTTAEFKISFPEFNAVEDAVVQIAISRAYEFSDVSRTATELCAAHLLSLVSEQKGVADGGSGTVEMEKMGPKQTKYKTTARDERDAFFSSSPYGRLFLTAERHSPRRVVSVVMG